VVTSAWVAWLSPIGWAQQMRPFGGEHWWVLLLFAGFVVAAAALAFALERRHDVGRGLIPERRGPAEAAPALGSALGLAWRIQRGTFFAWAVGVTIFGAVFGAVSNSFEEIISQVEGAADFFARAGGAENLADGFYSIIIGLMATVIAAYTIGALLRMRGEEAGGLLEPVLATAVSRRAWMASHAAVVVFATYTLLLLTGLSTALLVGLMQGDIVREVGRLVATAMVQAPAVLVLGGIALAAFAVAPRRAGAIAWGAFVVALVTGPMFGPMLDLPAAVLNLSPFTHVPALPHEPFVLLPIVALKAMVAALAVCAFVAFDRRDLDTHTGEGATRTGGETAGEAGIVATGPTG